MSSSSAAPQRRQRLDIQGLRAIAVVVVILDHVFAWPSGGFVGVDVFFVLSGYLITGLLLREAEKTGSISFTRFYARRAKRILPAAAIVVLATVLFARVLLSPTDSREVVWDGVFSALFVGNWRFGVQGTDYFQQGTPPSPLQHFWSLGVEEQFYLVWPWVMLVIVVLALRAGWRFSRTKRFAAIAIGVLTAASFAWALYETATNPAFAYFSTFSRAWELGIGALLAFLPEVVMRRSSRRILAYLGLAGILLSLFVVSGDSPLWPAPLALLPVVSSALVVLAGADATTDQPAPWILRNQVATYLGDVSYSLYLWHFPVAILLLSVLPEGSVRYGAAAIALTLVLSVLSYHLVENPARRATWFRGWRPTRAALPTLAGLAVVLVAAIGANAVIPNQEPAAAAAPVQTIDPADPSALAVDCAGAGSTANPEACADATFDALAPADIAADTGGAYVCYSVQGQEMQTCHYGSDDPGARKVALVGDSHAAALLPALEPQLAALGWSLDTYVGRGCQLADVAATGDCGNARAAIEERVTSGDYDLVIAASSRGVALDAAPQQAMIEKVQAAGSTIVAVADNPLADEESVACTTRVGATPGSDCATDAATALTDHTLVDAAEAAGAPVVDLTDLYACGATCPSIIGGDIVYRDAAGHITATWARTLSPYLARALLEAAPAA
ncbi:acyltransferase family protein [Microbacterium indicum]|uniref:acyltransferase family protein n=1 Tax=Microbacterium indicum TaxID=358100 RepID=UPI0003FC778B|nr:acyltransferase family protein [Microbacterium indicum]